MNSYNSIKIGISLDRFILLIPFLMWCLLPTLSYNLVARVLVVITLGAYFTLSFFQFTSSGLNKVEKNTLIVGLLLVYMTITNSLFSPPEYFLRHLHFSIFMVFIIVSSQLLVAHVNSAKLIVLIVFIANAITLLLTIKALALDHNTARFLSKSNEFSKELSASGLGGYGIVYANLVMLPVLFIFIDFLLKEKRKSRLMIFLCIVNIVLSIGLLIKAQYTIAIITMAIILTTLMYSYLKGSIFFLFGFVLILVAIYMSSSFIFDFNTLVHIFEGTRYQAKIIDLIAASSGSQESGGAVGSRSDAYLMSIITFFENPVFGVLGFGKGIGHHSDIMDKFAQWGLLVGLLIIYVCSYFPIKLFRLFNNEYKCELSLVIFSLFVVGVFNTITMEMSVPFVMLACFFVIKKYGTTIS
jgi:hypothetical protein